MVNKELTDEQITRVNYMIANILLVIYLIAMKPFVLYTIYNAVLAKEIGYTLTPSVIFGAWMCFVVFKGFDYTENKDKSLDSYKKQVRFVFYKALIYTTIFLTYYLIY